METFIPTFSLKTPIKQHRTWYISHKMCIYYRKYKIQPSLNYNDIIVVVDKKNK